MSPKTRAVLASSAFFVILLVAGLVSYDVARAENQVPTRRPTNHPNQKEVGRLLKGHLRTTTHGGDTEWVCLANSAGGGELIPWNSMATIHGAADGYVCWTMTIDGAEIAINTTTGVVTDSAGPDGAASCFRITDGETATWILDAYPFLDKTNGVMRRDGVCLNNDGGTYTGAPCVSNDECDGPDAGMTCFGGTTDGGLDQSYRITGGYLCWTAGAVDGVHIE